MAGSEHYDVVVIGSGEAGKYLAWTLATAGRRTAVIERKYIGGACPNIACLPSKNIAHSARVRSLAAGATEYGVHTGTVTTDMPAVQARKRRMVDALVKTHEDRYAATGVDVIHGHARFIAPGTVTVHREGSQARTITAEQLFLNVGTRAAVPDVPGLRDASPMTHVEALDLERIPGHLVVLGGGYVGLELAQAMRRLGAAVTVVERAAQLAGREDPDVADGLLELFRDEGIDVRLGTEVLRVHGRSGDALRLRVAGANGEEELEATHLLVAAGRTPNTDDLAAELAGIDLDSHGYVVVNERLEATAPNVWALGDCAGSPQFTHVSFDDFRIVRDNLQGGNRTTHDRIVPYCMFTDPPVARVGLNESQATEQRVAYRIARLPMAAVLRTRTTSETRGFLKMLIDEGSDRILGFTAFGAEASELMAAVHTAMLGGLPFTLLRDALFAHPTTAEGLNPLLVDVRSLS